MNIRLLVGILALMALLVFLLGYDKSALHYSKIMKIMDNKSMRHYSKLMEIMDNKSMRHYSKNMEASQRINSYQGEAESGRRSIMKNRERFLKSRATRWSSDKAFHGYLTSPDVMCNKSYRAGNIPSGGWDVCTAAPFLPISPCLVYSFGINYDFSFDDATAQEHNCIVKSFDPSMKRVESHKRGKNVYFIKEGIAGRDFKDKNGWNLFSFATILKKQNDTNRVIDYFKMDIEWTEWQVLPDMAARGLFKNIKQIGLEIHRPKNDLRCVQLIKLLEDNGFRKWKMHYNMAPSCAYKMKDGTKTSQCIEIYFINMNFIDRASIGSFVLN